MRSLIEECATGVEGEGPFGSGAKLLAIVGRTLIRWRENRAHAAFGDQGGHDEEVQWNPAGLEHTALAHAIELGSGISERVPSIYIYIYIATVLVDF